MKNFILTVILFNCSIAFLIAATPREELLLFYQNYPHLKKAVGVMALTSPEKEILEQNLVLTAQIGNLPDVETEELEKKLYKTTEDIIRIWKNLRGQMPEDSYLFSCGFESIQDDKGFAGYIVLYEGRVICKSGGNLNFKLSSTYEIEGQDFYNEDFRLNLGTASTTRR